MTVCLVSCMFQSCTSSPNNARSREEQAPAEPEMRIVVKRKLTVGGLISHLASVSHCHKYKFSPPPRREGGYVLCFFPHAISFWNMIPGSLLPLFKWSHARPERRRSNLHFPNITIQRCAQYPNNSCTIAVGTKSFPAPVSNVACSIESFR